MPKLPDSLPPEIIAALREGRQIEAIKLLRKSTGLGLVEAKGLMDAFLRSQADALLRAQAPAQAQAKSVGAQKRLNISVAPPPRPRDRNLSPGEVPRTPKGPWGILFVIAAALVAWFLVR